MGGAEAKDFGFKTFQKLRNTLTRPIENRKFHPKIKLPPCGPHKQASLTVPADFPKILYLALQANALAGTGS